MKVLLVTMPFAPLERPSLGLSLLKAELGNRDVACDVAYLNLAFADLVGVDCYERVAGGSASAALAGEWVFAESLFGRDSGLREGYVDEMLKGVWRLEAGDVEAVLHARARASAFVRRSRAGLPWSHYDVVGFTSVGPQNLAALALAKAIREEHPSVVIAFGGHNWEGVMGRELHRRFPFVDIACSGEADLSFPAVIERLDRRHPRPLDDVAGIVFRHAGRTRVTPLAGSFADLDALPAPDYTDFFESRTGSGAAGDVVLPVEASRGCWWAARKPCLFCGLSGTQRSYRAKTPGRALREMRELVEHWPCGRLDVVDNVVPPSFLSDVLPELAAHPLPPVVSFEVRPGIEKRGVRQAAAAGVWLQSGIESLSDPVLRRMHKGTTVLENVRLLKWCTAHGVRHVWNVMYGFPGESPQDYKETFELLPAIRFLDAPLTCGPMVLERFSPYLERPGAYGLRHVRPDRCYRYLYPFPDTALRKIAYFFDYDHPAEIDRPGFVQRLRYEIGAWRDEPGQGELRSFEDADGRLVIVDTRPTAAARETILDGLDQTLYEACEDICSGARLRELARSRSGNDADDVADDIDQRLTRFVRHRLMIATGDRYLSLALPREPG